MKTSILCIIPLGLLLTTSSCTNNDTSNQVVSTTRQEKPIIKKDVDVAEFATLVNNGKGQVLDVRTPEEWAEGVIEDAIKMNFFDEDFNAQLTQLDKNKPVYVYCKSGGRSGKTATQMEAMGFTAVYNLVGGIGAWDAAGNKKVK